MSSVLAEGKEGAFGSSWVSSPIIKKGTVDPQSPEEDSGIKESAEFKTAFIMEQRCYLPLLSVLVFTTMLQKQW